MTGSIYRHFCSTTPATDWLNYWEDNAENKQWDTFLLAVKQLFNPDLYEDYVILLASHRQTSTVVAYQSTFESYLQKVTNVGDSTLTSLFIAGLKSLTQQEMLTRRPSTLQEAFALAQQLAACQTLNASPSTTTAHHSTWSNRE